MFICVKINSTRIGSILVYPKMKPNIHKIWKKKSLDYLSYIKFSKE